MKKDVTDLSLFVRTTDETFVNWDKQKIVDALIRETEIAPKMAERISKEVEKQIMKSEIKVITSSLIRELVDAKLIEYGLEDIRDKHTRLGMPIYEVEQLLFQANKENANVPHNPEATNLIIAENVKKEYALLNVFEKDVADAHINGDIHIHDLGFIDRPYTFDGRENIIIKNNKENIYCVSFKNLFKMADFVYKENNVEIGLFNNYFVLDENNTWTKLERIIKKIKKRQMIWVKTKNSKSIILTDNHPFIINKNKNKIIKETKNLSSNDFIFSENILNVPQKDIVLNLTEKNFCNNNKNRVYYLDNIYIMINGEKKLLNNICINKFNNLQFKEYKFDLSKGIIYSKSLEGTNKSHSLPVLFNLTEDFCYFLGLFIAEGNYEKNGIALTIGKEYKEKIINFLKSYNFPYSIQKHTSNFIYKIRIYSSILNDLIYNYFSIGKGSKNICLPNSFITWNPKFSFALLCGIIDGDGNINKKRIIIRCASREMLTQINWLLMSQNIKCCSNLNGGEGSKRTYKGKEIIQKYDLYGVSFGIPKEKKNLFKMSVKCRNIENTTKFYYNEIDSIKTIKEINTQEEYIYDITTESHTFICNGFLVHNCSGQNIEYIKKFGLQLPHLITKASPAKHPDTLIGHLLKFSAALQGNFAGAIGWDAVNLFLAPYLVGKDQKEIKQLAQVLIYEFSQQAVARGGQAIFSDLNLYYEVPDHFKNVNAIGPGGQYTGYPYAAYKIESTNFLKALFEVYLEGDASGSPFFFPKPLFHITNNFFNESGHEEILELACELASRMGNTYFVFDRGKTAKISECCRLSFKLTDDDLKESNTPWKMRYSALQNVSINLPRIARKAKGDESILFNELERMIYYAASAHVEKRAFIKSLIDLGRDGPLSLLAMKFDGETYLRMDRLSYLVGMVGLNEMVWLHLGEQMHESEIAFKFGLKVIAFMNLILKKLSKKSKMHYVLEQTPAESTAYRFARLDQKQGNIMMQGDVGSDNVYYTNSTHFNVGADINPFERVYKEGLFHPLIEAGSISHVWLGEHLPDPKGLMNFVKKTFYKTQNDQIAFSPEFTNCLDCKKTIRGLYEKCLQCGSSNVEGITRITGYFTKISSWNKGKLAELKDRKKIFL